MPSKKAAKKSWYEKIVCLYNAFFFGEIGASFLACLTTVTCFANSKRKKAWQKKKRRDVGYRRPHPRHLLKKVDENNPFGRCEHTYKSQFILLSSHHVVDIFCSRVVDLLPLDGLEKGDKRDGDIGVHKNWKEK